jgi:5-formyltetrahydrofolate cyclo-ligase
MKKELREKMLSIRLSLSSTFIKDASTSLVQHIKLHPSYRHAKHIGIYHPIKNEPILLDLLQDQSKHFYLPKVVENSMIYVPFNQQTTLETSLLNIKEPESFNDQSHRLDLVIIPALAMDKQGNRLGFGKGFFDRFLTLHPTLFVIAVIYPFQLVDAIPVEDHDKQVNAVLMSD